MLVVMLRDEQKAPTGFALVVLLAFVGFVYVLNWLTDNPAATNAHFWFLARSAGFVAYELLALTALLGVSMTSQLWDRWKLRKLVNDVHQHASLLVLPFLLLHLWGLYNDKSVRFTLSSLLIPFHSNYRPMAVSAGITALYLLLAISISSYARPRIGVKTWRGIHYFSFPLFIIVSLHGVLSGTDSPQPWARILYIVPAVMFVGLTIKRLMSSNFKGGTKHAAAASK